MALTPAERQRAYRLKNPYKLTTTDIVVDGVKYTIPNKKGRCMHGPFLLPTLSNIL